MQSNMATWRRAWLVGCAAALVAGCGAKPMPVSPETQQAIDQANPQMQAVLDQLHKDGAKSFALSTVAEARGGPSAGKAALEVAMAQGKTPIPVGVSDTSFAGRDGNNVSLKVYTPQGDGTFPVVVYYHGGGWVVGSPLAGNPYDASCRALCYMGHAVVVEVDYRLAPENPYPAAVNDSYDAFQYVVSHADKFRGDGKHVAVAGESAGGNLAVGVALMAKDQGTPLPTSILSVYPVAGYNVHTASARAYAMAVPLDAPSLGWFYEKYVPKSADQSARYFNVAGTDLHGLPPTTIITAQIDPLHDDGVALADALRAAGVTTRYMNYDGVTHEFFGMGQIVDQAMRAETFAVDGLRVGFGM